MSRIALTLVPWLALAGAGACGGHGHGLRHVVVATPKLPPANPKAVREFDGAMRALKLGGPEANDQAQARLERAVELDPGLWEAWHDLGAVRFALGDDDGAVTAFSRALAINPAHAASLLARAEAHRRSGETDAARKDYEQALAQDSTQGPAYARAASLLREAGGYEDALDLLREGLRVVGARSDIYVELGLVYLAQGRDTLADLVLSKAVALDDKDPAIYNAMALVLLAKGKDQEAFERFYQAAALDPSFLDARYNVASVLIDSGDYARARDELGQIVQAAPDDFAAKVALGVAFRGLGDLEHARQTWDDVVKSAPKHSTVRGDALFNLAVLELDFTRDDKKAAVALDRFLQQAPESHPKRKEAEERRKDLGQ